jgi:hypothetical protein
MAFNLQLPGGLKPTNPTPADGWYNNGGVPYASTTEACTLIPRSVRYAGMTVLVGDVEYRWLQADFSDSGLVVKTSAAGAGGAGGAGSAGRVTTTYGNALNLIAQNQVADATYKFTDYPGATAPVYIVALDKSLFSTTGYVVGAGGNVVEYDVDVPHGTITPRTTGQNGESVFAADFTVSQAGSRTFGRFQDGDVVPAAGKPATAVILMAAIDNKFPTYNPAAIGISMSVPTDGEVGEAVANSLRADFASNDAGGLVKLRILRNNARLGNESTTSPAQAVDNTVRVLGAISYAAQADYLAGSAKNVQPANTPDVRPAQVRNPYAIQAAENNFTSGVINLNGYYRYFFGPVQSVPGGSAAVRALANSRLTNAGNQFVLDTGAQANKFALWLPNGRSLQSVVDQDALNADITSEYHVSDLAVNDAGGNPVAGKLYVMQQAVAYSSSHRHLITVG